MSALVIMNGRSVRILSLLLAVFLFGGCATYQVDWNSRIGVYTYDQTVVELGPPDRSAKLTDGTTVAEWLTHRGYSRGSTEFVYGYGHPYYYFPSPFYHHYYYYDPPAPDYYLRLTFNPEGKLHSWKRVTR
jgi:hypothetical protein